ncbi:hypothetical protein PoB_002461800 [Plakobranchus ocellatus]|uniref:Uncharacterized protein n=1 Tax=Plakobranchus ocellatus TaxID=259542 RepID=A0AAV3ZUK1_9GAST|nr:hypothetical protein PoB_002461800 [Plakobranchus ocellatus]
MCFTCQSLKFTPPFTVIDIVRLPSFSAAFKFHSVLVIEETHFSRSPQSIKVHLGSDMKKISLYRDRDLSLRHHPMLDLETGHSFPRNFISMYRDIYYACILLFT